MKVRSALRHMHVIDSAMGDLRGMVDYAHRTLRKARLDAVILEPTHVQVIGPSDIDGYTHIVVRWLWTSSRLDERDAA